MIDVILKAYWIEKRPSYGIVLGFIFACLGICFSFLIFKEEPSFPAVFLTTLAAIPVVIKSIKNEVWEPKFEKIFQRHKNVIEIYFYLFLGMSLAFALCYSILPESSANFIFNEQIKKFATGFFSLEEPFGTQLSMFLGITVNNMGLMFFFFILSLFYGSGSVFLLSWNASILGLMWGKMIKTALFLTNPYVFASNTFFNFPYLLPEIFAYFLASIAGAAVSINLTKNTKVGIAMLDSLVFLGISIAIIFIAGIIEVLMLSYFA